MESDGLLDRLRRLAQLALEEMLSSELLVRLPDGTVRSAIDLTDDELFCMEMPPMRRWAICVWHIRYMAAEKGFVYVGGGKIKHIDSLTREDIQPLRATLEARREETQAYVEMEDFVVGALMDLEKLGVEVDLSQSLADLLETGLD